MRWRDHVEFLSRRRQRDSPIDPSVSVQLQGGLGNQLFGYAAGRRQALRLGVPLHLGHTRGVDETFREFELGWLIGDGVLHKPPGPRSSTFVERSFRYDPAIETVVPGTHLVGYFQSSRYFGSAQLLRQELMVQAEARFGESLDAFQKEPFIAVHVRGGDYRSGRARDFHGLCSPDYFARSADELRRRLGDLPVIVFSDDWEGIDAGLSAVPGAVASGPDVSQEPAEVLFMMARAAGLVVSNSSFSWWAAWLASPSTVVTPTPWFSDPSVDTTDLREPTWLVRSR